MTAHVVDIIPLYSQQDQRCYEHNMQIKLLHWGKHLLKTLYLLLLLLSFFRQDFHHILMLTDLPVYPQLQLVFAATICPLSSSEQDHFLRKYVNDIFRDWAFKNASSFVLEGFKYLKCHDTSSCHVPPSLLHVWSELSSWYLVSTNVSSCKQTWVII